MGTVTICLKGNRALSNVSYARETSRRRRKGKKKKKKRKKQARFSFFSSTLASSLFPINLSALICPPFGITWLELNEVVERQVNNQRRSLDHHRGSVWFCLDSSSWTELNRAKQINCRGFGVFSFLHPSIRCFETKTKGSPQLAELPNVFAAADRHFLLPLLHLGGRRPLCWAGRWKSLTTSKPHRTFPNPSSNERRPSCTGAIMKASLGAGVIARGALAFPGRRLLGAHLHHRTHIHWRSGLPASAQRLG